MITQKMVSMFSVLPVKWWSRSPRCTTDTGYLVISVQLAIMNQTVGHNAQRATPSRPECPTFFIRIYELKLVMMLLMKWSRKVANPGSGIGSGWSTRLNTTKTWTLKRFPVPCILYSPLFMRGCALNLSKATKSAQNVALQATKRF